MNKAAIISEYKFLCGHKFSIPLGKNKGVRLLDLLI